MTFMNYLTNEELMQVKGGDGIRIIVAEGFLDGIEGNERLYIFGIRII